MSDDDHAVALCDYEVIYVTMLSAASRIVSYRGAAVSRVRCSVKSRRFNSSIKKETAPPRTSNDDNRIWPWYPIVGGLVITIAGGIKYCHDLFGGMEGLERAAAFYSLAIPRYVQYRFHMVKESPDEVWDSLHTETSQDALNIMLQLKGFYIKSGQICASNLGNAFPDIWIDTLSVLQDQVPAKDFSVVKEIIESEYGKPLEEVFATFDEEVIGAASIGQVHRATLVDGTPVVVKVMYPEVEGLFRGDVRTIKLFAQLAQPVHVPALEEIEKQFMTEFDYFKESKQLAQVRENLMKAGMTGEDSSDGSKLCAIPKPYLDLCTKRVLVMEELKGDKLAVGLRKDVQGHAARAGQTPEEFLAERKALDEEAEAQGKSVQGPTAQEFEVYRSILNRQRQLENAGAMIYNTTFGWLPGKKKKQYKGKDTLPINQAKLVDDLIYVHGHEVLVDGYFNGDPHPGNILLLGVEEGNPRLGLIDYGQVKQLSKKTRLLLCKLIIALDDDNRDEIVSLMKQLGYKSRDMNEDNIYLYAKVGYDEDNHELTGGKHIQIFMEDLQSKDPIIELPRELLMVSRASTMLRGLAHYLHQSRSVAKIWRPIAEQVLKEEGDPIGTEKNSARKTPKATIEAQAA